MMDYLIFKFLHIIGFILIGGGLVSVFIADLRSRQTADVRVIAEACRYEAVFYDGVVVPGAILVLISGPVMIFKAGFGFFQMPWLTGMWILFAFEFVEGNTITRIHFRRMLKWSRAALSRGDVTAELRNEMERRLPTFTHYLDIPLFALIVCLGALRPSTWGLFAMGLPLALAAAVTLGIVIPRIYRWPLQEVASHF
jgi:uncharacterized membrane protein